MVCWIGRVQLCELLGRQGFQENRAGDLLIHVPAQIPRHGFAPGDRVDRCPRLDLVVGGEQTENSIFETDGGGMVIFQVGVHACRVRVEHRSGFRVQAFVFEFGNLTPAEGAEEAVGFHLAAPEHLGQRAGADVAPGIHLPETILGVNIALRKKQVMGGGGINVRDSHRVAIDIYGTVQALELDLAFRLRERFRRHRVWQIAPHVIQPRCSHNERKHNQHDQTPHQKDTQFSHRSSGIKSLGQTCLRRCGSEAACRFLFFSWMHVSIFD